MTAPKPAAIGYVRVSTEDQSLGPEAQRAALAAFAKARGLRLVAVYEDRLSGATPVDARPGLMAAMQALREHGATLLLATKRDRIARDVVTAATVEALAKQAGAAVITADGVSADDTPEGALMRTLLDAFAQYERALIRARTKAALAAKKAKGERLGRPRYGWRVDGGQLVEEPGEQAVIRRALQLRQAGQSLRAVAATLSLETGRAFYAQQVARLEA